MKKIIILFAFIGLLNLNAFAQWNLSLATTGVKYFGKVEKYPLGTPKDMKWLMGGKIRGSYGFGRYKDNMVSFGFSYILPLSNQYKFTGYYGATMKASMMELEVNYHRYIKTTFITSKYAFYVLAGGSARTMKFDFTVPDPILLQSSTGEARYFEDEKILGLQVNLGAGAEYNLNDLYVFLEGKAAIHANAYVDKTTIWENPLVNYWNVSFGVRIPTSVFRKGKGPKQTY